MVSDVRELNNKFSSILNRLSNSTPNYEDLLRCNKYINNNISFKFENNNVIKLLNDIIKQFNKTI